MDPRTRYDARIAPARRDPETIMTAPSNATPRGSSRLPAPSTGFAWAAAAAALLAGCNAAPGPTEGPGEAARDLPAVAERVEAPFDALHCALLLDLDPRARRFEGLCSLRVAARGEALESIELELDGPEVRRVVAADGTELAWDQSGGGLEVRLASPVEPGATAEVLVEYSSGAGRGVHFAGDGAAATHAFALADSASGWAPTWEDPGDLATRELVLTMPVDWRGAAPGSLVSRTAAGGRATEHWHATRPYAPRLSTFAVGPFASSNSDARGVPVLRLVREGDAPALDAALASTPAALAFLEQLTGAAYPYAKYAQLCVGGLPDDGRSGAGTALLPESVVGGEKALRDGGFAELVARDAARQWFGGLVGAADDEARGVLDAFAGYAGLMFVERREGVDAFRARMTEERLPGAALPNAVARVHLLRRVLGDATFESGLRTLVAEHSGRVVDVADVQRALEKVSGRELDRFFDEWMLGAGVPTLEVSRRWDRHARVLRVHVEQIHEPVGGLPGAFAFPLDLEIRDARGVAQHSIQVDGRVQDFEVPAPEDPEWVCYDKYGWLPARIETERGPAEWLAIAAADDDVAGRAHAFGELARLARGTRGAERELYVAELTNRLLVDRSSFVRAAACTALGSARGLEARQSLLRAAARDESSRVRAAALDALVAWGPDGDLARFAESSFAEGYSWATMLAAARLRTSSGPIGAYAWLSRQLLLDSPQDRLRAGLLEILAETDHEQVEAQLGRWATDEQSHPHARGAALRALASRGSLDEEWLEVATRALASTDPHLRADAIDALATSPHDEAREALEAYYARDARPDERRVIEAALPRRR